MERINKLLSDASISSRVDAEWDNLGVDFELAHSRMPVKFMARGELSFHDFVKLLAFLCLDTNLISGCIVEIGVWKGKSLALMQRFADPATKVIGIDPCEIDGQPEELAYFHENLFPRCILINTYSQLAVQAVTAVSDKIKVLHIDGGHASANVWMDFLIYEHFVVSGGYIVFDDYDDHEFSPAVRPAVDRLHDLGLFRSYDVIGSVPTYENSYVLRKR